MVSDAERPCLSATYGHRFRFVALGLSGKYLPVVVGFLALAVLKEEEEFVEGGQGGPGRHQCTQVEHLRR